MDERLPCEFFLIRYVPDRVKGEFVNIGVVLREASGFSNEPRKAAVRFTRNWSRVRCMDADADIAVLEGLEEEIASRLSEGVSAPGSTGVIEGFLDSWSNSLQLKNGQAYLAMNLKAGVEELMKVHVEPPRARGAPRPKLGVEVIGRPGLTGAMRRAFELERVWKEMRKRIAVSEYTRQGDPLRIDCGYRPNGVTRMFHAVSLASDVEGAKIISFAAPGLVEGVKRVDASDLELTAVVEVLRTVSNSDDEAGQRYRFGKEIMEQAAIRVITVNDLARAAATAKRELGV